MATCCGCGWGSVSLVIYNVGEGGGIKKKIKKKTFFRNIKRAYLTFPISNTTFEISFSWSLQKHGLHVETWLHVLPGLLTEWSSVSMNWSNVYKETLSNEHKSWSKISVWKQNQGSALRLVWEKDQTNYVTAFFLFFFKPSMKTFFNHPSTVIRLVHNVPQKVKYLL